MVPESFLERFYEAIHPSRPNEWEVDELLEQLEEVPHAIRELLLDHVPAIWPVSHSLCFDFLRVGSDVREKLSSDLFPEWVRCLLSVYEKGGLQGAREFMADIDAHFLAPMRGESGVLFDSVVTRLLHFIRGVSGRSLQLEIGSEPRTDTETIYLPSTINLFSKKEDNEWLYKVLVVLQWTLIQRKVYSEQSEPGANDPWKGFEDEQLAKDLFCLQELFLSWEFLRVELPGLVGVATPLFLGMLERCEEVWRGCSFRQEFISDLLRSIFFEEKLEHKPLSASMADLYARADLRPGSYSLGDFKLIAGDFNFTKAKEKIAAAREKRADKFKLLVADLLAEDSDAVEREDGSEISSQEADVALAILKKQIAEEQEIEEGGFSLDLQTSIELPDELRSLVQEILDDLGEIPDTYFQAAAGIAGGGRQKQDSAAAAEEKVTDAVLSWSYDEWDYRRGGYRRDWCVVYEKELNEVRSDFVLKTLQKYDAQLKRLKRQFEALRTRQRFVRRRRDGDDIDLDALIDALGDSRAGLSPSDRVFVKLLRDDRDITAMFLVDMSNSTEGWVGNTLKEALVLLAEALEVAQDRYGIYGFSGMRRSKSEVYRIKDPGEVYNGVIQRRIASIMPMEYTRMGPAIRHIVQKLMLEQSRIRILIVLSDGKPEDYDDYKAQYAIEDTRKALLEARGAGVFVFCITIDRAAHDYLEHMFGRGNYIFVEDLSRLPEKMAEMYRLLTS